MTHFSERYAKLNDQQQAAVDTIEGPLLVIAGPGTGKTELLSMRAANILQKTDTLPQNILCLTFTDSGAAAMRSRLADIIGPDAYKVAIHTFHSFGTEIINQENQYFYRGATFQPADELTNHRILTEIFDELEYTSPLAGKLNGEYTHLKDTMRVIGELKQSGVSSEELLTIISANEAVLDNIENDLAQVFSERITKKTLVNLAPLAKRIAELSAPQLPSGITPLANVLALSMAHAFDESMEIGKTTPITAWRREWMEKNTKDQFVFKDRKRHNKLRAVARIYFSYMSRMEQAGLFDYDDMILNVVHGMELYPDLRFNLQEKYQYIMVDEFQDTNLAQLRILFNLTSNPSQDHSPNIMAVGDDDQAIYSFQGADINNIHRFREEYRNTKLIALKDNYRSSDSILMHAREVITQGQGRLEATIADLNKTLTAHHTPVHDEVRLHRFETHLDEHSWIAHDISRRITEGQDPSSICVLARRHNELVKLLPHLYHQNILVNYERRDNILDLPVITTLELVADIVLALHHGEIDVVDSRLPELLSHPAFAIDREVIWRLSLQSYRNRATWLEVMATTPELQPVHSWLLDRAGECSHLPLEQHLDILLGVPADKSSDEIDQYASPLYEYFFSQTKLTEEPDKYLRTLDALRLIRTKLRDYHTDEAPRLIHFAEFLELHRQMGNSLTSVRRTADHISSAINVMTAHKSKGLEFETVYIIGAVDSSWGERVKIRSRLIGYPENLPIAPAGNTYDERLRLFFVAMTRARSHLIMSYSSRDDNGKELMPASFLIGTTLETHVAETPGSNEHMIEQARISWQETLTAQPSASMRELLTSQLDSYKLSATHVNNFLDLTHGGPTAFLLNNLLKFPQAKSASASYGTAIHAALQRAHNHFTVTGEKRPVEDILGDFAEELNKQRLDPADADVYLKKGNDALMAFLNHAYSTFSRTQKTELSFASQQVMIGEARLTGNLDLVEVIEQSIKVTDYKTGKPSQSWKGSQDFEKIKLHKYKQQLMFYQLLIENSRDYAKYDFAGGVLQFVEPDLSGTIHSLEITFTDEELDRFQKLIQSVWKCVMTLDLPDISTYEQSYAGILKFEQSLIDRNS